MTSINKVIISSYNLYISVICLINLLYISYPLCSFPPQNSSIMDLQNIFSVLASFLFLSVLFNLIIKKCFPNKTSTSTNLPPGPWKLPLIGNIHQVVITSLPLHQHLRNLATKYGPLMHLKLGEVSNIIVSSPDMAEQIMKTQDLSFCDRPLLLISAIFSYNGTTISFSPYGNYWRQLRKICTMELLSAKRVQTFRQIREEEVSKLVKTIQQSEGSAVNLSEMFVSMTYGIVSRVAFGKKNRYQQRFISEMEESLILLGSNCFADFFPSIGVLRKMSRAKARFEELHRGTDMILQEIIDDHRNGKGGNCEGGGEDLVDVLLKFQKEAVDSEYPLTDGNIKAVIQDIFVGGGETSSSIVEWAMTEMMKNPNVMEKAQSEVRNVYATKYYVDETELHQLTYLKCVIKEILRLHPPTPLLIPRMNRESCQIKGYNIPQNSNVLINCWAIGRDQRYWGDNAECFIPERFINNTIDYKGTNFEYIPFGAGRRMCPGMTFATPNMELPLAQLLYHFDWKLPNGMKIDDLDMTESFTFTLKRENDLCLVPITHQAA